MKKVKRYLEKVDPNFTPLKDKSIPVWHFGIESPNMKLDKLLDIAKKENYLNLDEISLTRMYSFGGDWYSHFEFVYNRDL